MHNSRDEFSSEARPGYVSTMPFPKTASRPSGESQSVAKASARMTKIELLSTVLGHWAASAVH